MAFRRSGVQGFGGSGTPASDRTDPTDPSDCRTPEPLNPRAPEHLNAGFTLIELLVVLIALVIVAATVVPSLRGAGHRADLTEVAARVAASARFARDEAVARQVPIVMTVDSSPAAVRLAVDTQSLNAQGMIGAAGPATAMNSGTSPPASPAATVALPASYALVSLPPQCQARLEAVPGTLNGAATSTPPSGGSLDAVRFPPDGRTVGGAVVLTDSRGRLLRVTVAPDTGVVRIEAANG